MKKMKKRLLFLSAFLLPIAGTAAPVSTVAGFAKLYFARASRMLDVVRAVDERLDAPEKVQFRREPFDQNFLALSLPWDLPNRDFPNRAVWTGEKRLDGKKYAVLCLAPLAVLDNPDSHRRAVLSEEPLIYSLVLAPPGALPTAALTRLVRALSAKSAASGQLGTCKGADWCEMSEYEVEPNASRYGGVLIAERRGDKTRAIKLVRSRR